MALFLETHELAGRDAAAVVGEQSRPQPGRTCLQHWLDGDGRTIEFLVESPDRPTLLAATTADHVTELFAPMRRWLADDPVYPA